MEKDSIVEEVRAAREQFAKEHGYDIDAMVRALQEESERRGHDLVKLAPRRVGEEDVREAS